MFLAAAAAECDACCCNVYIPIDDNEKIPFWDYIYYYYYMKEDCAVVGPSMEIFFGGPFGHLQSEGATVSTAQYSFERERVLCNFLGRNIHATTFDYYSNSKVRSIYRLYTKKEFEISWHRY
jgi:hypothetical protein